MNVPRFISRWFSHDLPPVEEAERAAREAERPWVSEEAYDAFAQIEEVQGEQLKEGQPA